jgi:hypothetical protein
MDHIDKEWVPMNTKEKIKDDYFRPWDRAGGEALSQFTKRLDEKKNELFIHNIINIDEEDVKEHYVVQIYDSGAFDEADMKEWEKKNDMKEWEKKNEADKNDWTSMKDYFQDKMKLNDAYHNNNEGNEATYHPHPIIQPQQVAKMNKRMAKLDAKFEELMTTLTFANKNPSFQLRPSMLWNILCH